MRSFRGPRLVCFVAGLNALTVGAVMSLGYLSLRTPTTREVMEHPELEDVVYDVPRWLLSTGLVLVGIGLMSCLVAWYTSPQWLEGPPFGRRGGRLLLSNLATGWLAVILVAVAARESGVIGWWLLLLVAPPIIAVWFAWTSMRTDTA